MKTFQAVLVNPVQIQNIHGEWTTFDQGCELTVEISEREAISSSPTCGSQVVPAGIIIGTIGSNHFELSEDEYIRTSKITDARDPLPIIVQEGQTLRVHLKLIPGVMTNPELLESLVHAVKEMASDLGASEIIYDAATDTFELTATDTNQHGYAAA